MKQSSSNTLKTAYRIACLAVMLTLAAVSVVLYLRYGKALWSFVGDTDRFRAWIGSYGVWSGAVFTAIRAVQTVVKIVPAEPLEIGSGLAFGAVGGMLLCLLGNMIGSVVILFLARKLGTQILDLFGLRGKLDSMHFLQDKEKRRRLLILFFLIPGTPKDGITYFVGLTDMHIGEFLLISALARIPSILSSTICGAFLGRKNWGLAIGVFAATCALGLLGGFLYKKITARYGALQSSGT